MPLFESLLLALEGLKHRPRGFVDILGGGGILFLHPEKGVRKVALHQLYLGEGEFAPIPPTPNRNQSEEESPRPSVLWELFDET